MSQKKLPSKSAECCFFTSGEVFGRDLILDLVLNSKTRVLEMLSWNNGKATVAPQISHEHRSYRPIELDPTVVRAVRWPTAVGKFGTTKELFADLLKVVRNNTGLPDHIARLVVYFVFSTWMAEWLPLVPSLGILGSYTSEAIQLLRLLGCLCRRAILIGNLSQAELLSTSVSLGPTLLLDRPRLTPAFQHVLSHSNRRGPGFLNKGKILEVCSPRAMFIGTNELPKELVGNSVQIALPVPEGRPQILDTATLDKIAEEFQNKLLAYRLANYRNLIAPSPVVGCRLNHDTMELATSLATCVSDDPGLAAQVFPLLQAQSDAARGDAEAQFDEWIGEALLACLHRKSPRALLKELTKSVNTISLARGELFEFSPEDVGRRLRSLGFFTKRAAAGKYLQLDRSASIIVHGMAREHDVLAAMHVVKDCPDCNSPQIVDKKPSVYDVHEVHDKTTGRKP